MICLKSRQLLEDQFGFSVLLADILWIESRGQKVSFPIYSLSFNFFCSIFCLNFTSLWATLWPRSSSIFNVYALKYEIYIWLQNNQIIVIENFSTIKKRAMIEII